MLGECAAGFFRQGHRDIENPVACSSHRDVTLAFPYGFDWSCNGVDIDGAGSEGTDSNEEKVEGGLWRSSYRLVSIRVYDQSYDLRGAERTERDEVSGLGLE